jgi:hypothetical protein
MTSKSLNIERLLLGTPLQLSAFPDRVCNFFTIAGFYTVGAIDVTLPSAKTSD